MRSVSPAWILSHKSVLWSPYITFVHCVSEGLLRLISLIDNSKYFLFDLCHYIHCCLLESVHCLSVPDTVTSVHCLSVPDTVTSVHYLSIPHTVESVHCLSVPDTVTSVNCLSVTDTVTSVHCLSIPHTVKSVHCLPVPHTLLFVRSVSLCTLLSSIVCPMSLGTWQCNICLLSISNSHSTVSWFCVTMPTAVSYSLFNVSQYLTMYRLSTVCQYLIL